MEANLHLGTVAGVRVGINWSVLAIFLLITAGLAGGTFPAAYPDQSVVAYIVAGLVAGVVFFLSLLAHELAHAVVARREGLHVPGIVLWLFGGVAKLEGEPDDPGADLRIAGVGPLVSLLLAGVFYALATVLGAAGDDGIVAGAVAWLAVINLVLAGFNLVPAAPLDGGRILRAILWKVRGERHSAAITAARAGKVFGFVLIGLGLLELFLLASFGGIWLVLIGWFLTNIAGVEETQAHAKKELAGYTIADVMSADPAVAPADLTVEQLLEDYVLRHRYSAFPLVDDTGGPVGLVTLNRVKRVAKQDRATTRATDIAAPMEEVATARPDEEASTLLRKLASTEDGRVLVLHDDHVVGIVSATDLTRRLELAEFQPDQPTSLGS